LKGSRWVGHAAFVSPEFESKNRPHSRELIHYLSIKTPRMENEILSMSKI
jgi:hypothetical protein